MIGTSKISAALGLAKAGVGTLFAHWRLIGFLAMAGGLVLLGLLLMGEKVHSAKLQTALTDCGRTLENERQAIRDKTSTAQANDTAHAKTVETADLRKTMEKNDALQKQLGDARRRYDALRLQSGAAQADPGSGGIPDMPGIADAAGGADGAGGIADVSPEDRLICEENTIKAKGWQDWWKSIQLAPR